MRILPKTLVLLFITAVIIAAAYGVRVLARREAEKDYPDPTNQRFTRVSRSALGEGVNGYRDHVEVILDKESNKCHAWVGNESGGMITLGEVAC